jgi:lipopolysaccharide assembly outer membrane protein LptD (OstA)
MNPLRRVVYACAVLMLASSVQAQPPAQVPVVDSTKSDSREGTNQQKDWHFIGHVEFEDKETKIYADDAWYYQDGSKFIAKGNVVFAQADNRISAERIEFNTDTRLGTFYNAYGISTVKPQRQRLRAGEIAPPPMAGQDTVVYFFGESIEKLGPKKYKISKGGFSTCVQPTPRWDLVADTVTLNVDHYTFMKQAVFRVKGVPMFYLPVLYYPTKKEDRATGFLIPAYGSSTLRGQSIHNAFFWAVDRSQDATVLPRLVFEYRSGRRQRVPLQLRRGGRRDVQGVHAQRSRDHRRGPVWRRQAGRRTAQLRAPRRRQSAAAGPFPRESERQLFFQHRDVADVEHQHLRYLAQPARFRRQRGWHVRGDTP